MKIGLIGINMYPKYLNFACPLHTYAFQQFLLQNGIESTIIDYKPVYWNNFNMCHPADYYKNLYEKQLKRKPTTLKGALDKAEKLEDYQAKYQAWNMLYTEREIRYEKFQNFIDNNYIKTKEKYNSDLLETKNPGFDCYICVTDVIWKVLPTHTFDRGFLLGSTSMDGKIKISYAASRGVPQPYSEEVQSLFFRYIKDIDAISVREESLKNFIEENSNQNASLVLDPVLLHDKTFWQKISIKPKEENFLVLYYVMEEAADTIERAVEYAKENDLLIVELSDRPEKNGRINDKDVKHIYRYDIGMEEWLGYLEHAKCVFTNSFHGICFSIIFEKLLFVGMRNGDKVTNILKTFGMEDRLMPENGIPLNTMPKKIDYTAINACLDKKRTISKTFILNAIRDAKRQHLLRRKKKTAAYYEQYRKELKYPVRYYSGKPDVSYTYDTSAQDCEIVKFGSGRSEYHRKGTRYQNNGFSILEKNQYQLDGYTFIGWHIRIRIDNHWFWLMDDGTLIEKGSLSTKKPKKKKKKTLVGKIKERLKPEKPDPQRILLPDESTIPYIPVNRIRSMVAEACWKKN